MTLLAQPMKSVTNWMESASAQLDTMETNANLVSKQFQVLFKNLIHQGGFQSLDLIIMELKSHMTCCSSMPLIG